ncbi:aminoglycoside phosphotransferase family protein [Sedimentitalea todarodis]|uniref:Aminoglycoside phosphotransferase family protein n=1 Tax=Sedimentitalea todarodis TaxID=1631240 RepID=A0ABU3VG10_9RHOB|nr:aminoglycoside phosphotransferase family protein [Sedimentitalea todarodis]MDU9005100.1 aminoglycoside phosphotransferase family protein [Sedimentitalea todarodis]
MPSLHQKCAALIEELGIASQDAVSVVAPLTGGVASDIARVDVEGRSLCVKFALPKLKVSADWRAPVHRNAAEYAWLEVAAAVCPEASIKLFGRSASQHGFAMEFLDGKDVYLWKQALLDKAPFRGEAGLVGDMLGRIHAASAAGDFDRSAFHNRDDFRALRIEPYLTFTAQTQPQVAQALNDLAEVLYASDQVLVHGDVSPKNIVFRAAGPVLLDAECATMGDASFDPSFCINHLVLKAIHLPKSRNRLLADIGHFWAAYGAQVTWEDPRELEARICRLVPALMLGRIDGKSPVEYLDDDERDFVRSLAIGMILGPVPTLSALAETIEVHSKERLK